MKTIKVKFVTPVPRTMDVNMHGFEGPAKKPLKSFLIDGGRAINEGEITGNFSIIVPPDGNFEVVDTPKNRERLKILTKPSFTQEIKKFYDPKTGLISEKLETVEMPICYFITDGTVLEDDSLLDEEETIEISKNKPESEEEEVLVVKPRGKNK